MNELATDVHPPAGEVPTMGGKRLELCVADRCDRCCAQAFVLTMHEAGPLFWCAHHAHAQGLVLEPFIVADRRDALTDPTTPVGV